jgi:hypothetical protein
MRRAPSRKDFAQTLLPAMANDGYNGTLQSATRRDRNGALASSASNPNSPPSQTESGAPKFISITNARSPADIFTLLNQTFSFAATDRPLLLTINREMA